MVETVERRLVGWNVSPPTALFLLFLALKLGVGDTVVQDWSWWWVTAPLWVPSAVVLLLLALIGIIKLALKFLE